MIVSRGKFEPTVLIDLVEEPERAMERQQMVEKLLPAHGKLDQYQILFADP